MSVKIRLQRLGRTHHAHFRIVAADARSPRNGRFIEKLGTYDPHSEFNRYQLNHDAALKWLQQGAQPTDTVRNILSEEGVMLRLHLLKQGKSAEEVQKLYEEWKATRDRKVESLQHTTNKKKEEAANAALARESAKRKDRAAAISARLQEAAQAAVAEVKAAEAEASGEEVAEEAAEEAAPEAGAEA